MRQNRDSEENQKRHFLDRNTYVTYLLSVKLLFISPILYKCIYAVFSGKEGVLLFHFKKECDKKDKITEPLNIMLYLWNNISILLIVNNLPLFSCIQQLFIWMPVIKFPRFVIHLGATENSNAFPSDHFLQLVIARAIVT